MVRPLGEMFRALFESVRRHPPRWPEYENVDWAKLFRRGSDPLALMRWPQPPRFEPLNEKPPTRGHRAEGEVGLSHPLRSGDP